jgi:mannose-1-phosphate guanylyltransferase/phosphomannomutase
LEKIMTDNEAGARSIKVLLPPKYKARKPLSAVPGKFVAGILAAGVARRLEPISSIIAKPMFPLGGDFPICQNWVERLERVGIGQVGMNLYAVPISIKQHFGDGSTFLTEISYAHEETSPSGTLGGAIKIMDELERKIGSTFDTIIIPSGDVITEMTDDDFMAMLALHKQNGAAATLLLTPVPWHTLGEFGTVELEGIEVSRGKTVDNASYAKILTFNEKDPNAVSNLVNASCYIFEKSFLASLRPLLTECTPDREKVPEPFYDFGQHVFPAMLGKLPYRSELAKHRDALFGFVSNAVWFDIGRKRDYLELNKSALLGHIRLHIPYPKMPGGYYLGANTHIAEGAIIIPPVIIGNDCDIATGATIGPNTVLGNGWKVGSGTTVSNTVAWRHYSYTNIPKDRQIGENLVVDQCILVGGVIKESMKEKVADLGPNGQIVMTGIDTVPNAPRA